MRSRSTSPPPRPSGPAGDAGWRARGRATSPDQTGDRPGRQAGATRWLIVLGAAVVGVGFGWPALGRAWGEPTSPAGAEATVAAVGALATLVASAVAVRSGLGMVGRQRSGWCGIGAGAAIMSIGTIIGALGQGPTHGLILNSGASPVQLGGLALMAVGAAVIPSTVTWSAVSRIDAALVVLAGATLMWLAPLRTDRGPQGGLTQVLRGEPGAAVAVVLILVGAVMLVRCTPGRGAGIWLLTAALLAYPAAVYTALVGRGIDAGGAALRVSELWWLIGPVFLYGAARRAGAARSAAGRHSRHIQHRRHSQHRRDSQRGERNGESGGALAALAVIVTLTAVAFHETVMTSLDLTMLAMGVLTVVLAGGRMWVLQSRQVRLQTELHDLAGELADEARRDGLTGLGNRLGLDERLQRTLGDPGEHGVSVFYIDVDNFKTVNDVLGHRAGDELLVQLSVRLTDVLGGDVFRVGGDEFVAVREDLDGDRSSAVAAGVVAAMAPPITVDGHPISAGVSIGLARSHTRSPGDQDDRRSDDADGLLRRADLALYRAKELGRGRSAVYDGWLQERADRRLSLEQSLRRTIDREPDERAVFDVTYEPIVELPTRRVVGAEAVLRWGTSEHGLLLHDQLMVVAADGGMVAEVTKASLQAAIAPAADVLLGDGTPLRLAVNLSAQEVGYGGLVDTVVDTVATTGIDPAQIEFEVTERVLMDPAAGPTLDALVTLGAGLVVRDFGTGSWSLRRLGRFPDPTIKVDRSFVVGLGGNSDDQMIMEAVAELATELGFTITADGVMHDDQAIALERLGTARAQGPLFGIALHWDDFAARHVTRRGVGVGGPRGTDA